MEQNDQHNKLTRTQTDGQEEGESNIEEYLNSFPVGVRFFPSDEELIEQFLKKKVMNQPIFPNVIQQVNIYQHNPQQLTGMYNPLTETEWYFFACRDRKYPKGYRLNRATPDGFWKKNCKKTITLDSKNDPIGYREFYAFFEMENQQVRSTDWRMHEYSIHNKISPTNQESAAGNGFQLDEWVLCRIYKKKDNNTEEEDNETLNPKLAQGHDLFDDYLQLTANNPFPYQKTNGCFDDLEEVDLWSM